MSLLLGQRKLRRRAITGRVRGAAGLARRAAPGIRRAVRGLRPVGVRRRRRRARGISGTELRGFKKVARLLANFGMRPRGLARPAAGPRRTFGPRRRGDVGEDD